MHATAVAIRHLLQASAASLLAAVCAAPAAAAHAITGLDMMVAQSMAVFERAPAACSRVAPEASRAMRAALPRLRRVVREATRRAHADQDAALTQPLTDNERQAALDVAAQLAQVLGERMRRAAQQQGAPYCSALLARMRSADTARMEQRLRARRNAFAAGDAAAAGLPAAQHKQGK